jgi:cation:H+ antiporter
VGFGTSTPELVTSIEAALVGSPGIAVGNVVGSNIANILLILGVAAVIGPIACDPAAFRRDGTVLALSAVIGGALILWGEVGRLAGLVLIALLVLYTVVTLVRERRRPDAAAAVYQQEADFIDGKRVNLGLAIGLAAAGIGGTIFGAQLLIDGATSLARALGVAEEIIGLTLVAVGTSLPELATSVMAALRRQADVAFGNVVGSNIYNILFILGATALVEPLAVPARIAAQDLWVMLGATALMAVFAMTDRRIVRWEGGVFLALYAGYIGWLASGA